MTRTCVVNCKTSPRQLGQYLGRCGVAILQCKQAGFPSLLQRGRSLLQAGRAAAATRDRLTRPLLSLAGAGKQTAQTVSHGVSTLGSQLGQYALPGLNRARQSVAQAPAKVKETLHFMAGRKPDEAIGVRGVANLLVRPRYPGLDRPVGVTRAPWRRAVARPWDRTRQGLASGARAASSVVGAGTAASGAYGLMYEYPDALSYILTAYSMPQATKMPGRPYLMTTPQEVAVINRAVDSWKREFDARHQQTYSRLKGGRWLWEMAPVLLKQQIPGLASQDAVSRAANNYAWDYLPRQARYDIYNIRRKHPWLYGLMDAARSLTPIGALTTAGLRQVSSPQRPDTAAALRHFGAALPEIVANPAAAEQSPFLAKAKQLIPYKVRQGLIEEAPYLMGLAPIIDQHWLDPAVATKDQVTNHPAVIAYGRVNPEHRDRLEALAYSIASLPWVVAAKATDRWLPDAPLLAEGQLQQYRERHPTITALASRLGPYLSRLAAWQEATTAGTVPK